MAEELVAWAEDCVVRGEVDLPDGRLSDVVNTVDLVSLRGARLEALDDGRVVEVPELEVPRRDLHLVLLRGREGDPSRRLRTVREPVVMEIGPFTVAGNLHRAPNAAPEAALHRWTRFIPVTEATVTTRDGASGHAAADILVNRDLIAKYELLNAPGAAEVASAPGSPFA